MTDIDLSIDDLVSRCFREEALSEIPDESRKNLAQGWAALFFVVGFLGIASTIGSAVMGGLVILAVGVVLTMVGCGLGVIIAIVGLVMLVTNGSEALSAINPVWFVSIAAGVLSLAAGPSAFAGMSRSAYVKRRLAEYAANDPEAVQGAHAFATEELRRKIEAHRKRTLGEASEWGRAWSKVTECADEAQRSVAYWRERLGSEPGGRARRDPAPARHALG